MENPQYFYMLQLGSNAIGNDIMCIGHDQLAGIMDAARMAEGRVIRQ